MPRTITLSLLSVVAVAALGACSGTAVGDALASREPFDSPSPRVVSTPAAPATATPTPAATLAASAPPSAGGPLSVVLATATGHRVTIDILDESGHVVAARSGQPGDGASVPFGTVVAENVDARTVRLTWSDTPGDAKLGLYVDEAVDVVLVIRPERPAGDAIAFDRVLVVEFDRPVDAASLRLGTQEGLDTAG